MTLADVAQSRFTYENSHEIMETLRRRSQPWDYCGDRVKYRHDILRFKNILTPRYDERDWVLCNLSKREFVLSEAIRDLTSCDHLWGIRDGPFNSYQKVGFHTVLLARGICWSSTSIAQGVWAGDCFHIMPMTRFKERMQIAEWKDASSELIAEIEEMWKREYGERWEEYL
ncbi:hypothetical protein FA95DRAFT_1227129 [Auriscalpium vulgare]|uniref:Uncharacterized protein n=1 Tax=Auriscalpium vulgare TaxID=40419 RepID=A0ACB8RT06_9AGAM|nr:hypothetical protein FA95DRAFT_1227129 [Auriscalpium vulgare]